MVRRPETRRWIQMGVELEGAWIGRYADDVAKKVKGAECKTDGSIKGLRGDMKEIITRPHAIIDHLCEDVTTLYPDATNMSCGFHIHASFTPLDYALLTEDEFYKYYRTRWETWGKKHQNAMGVEVAELFWLRWEGRKIPGTTRSFCEDKNDAVGQLLDVSAANGDKRYTALNYAAWHRHKTLESRLLPMMPNAELACAAIRELSDIYDDYLNTHKFPEIKLHQVLEEGENGVIVERRQRELPDTSLLVVDNPSRNIPGLPEWFVRDGGLEHDDIGSKYFVRPGNRKPLDEEL